MLSFVLVLVLIVSVLVCLLVRWELSSKVKTINLIPGPKRTWILGNAWSMPTASSSAMLALLQEQFVQQYGRIYRIWLGFQTFVDISSPQLLEKILTSNKFINKGNSYDVLMPWLGDGLLLASDDKWRRNRRLLTPAFHFQILENFFDVFDSNANIFCQQLQKVVGTGQEIDVYPYLKRCTLDVICETAMGIQVNAQLEDSDYIKGVQRISEVLLERFFSFGLLLLPDWLYYLTPLGREHAKLIKQMHDFTTRVIRERKKELERESLAPTETQQNDEDSLIGLKDKKRAFLDLMLIAAKEGANLSDLDIRNEVDTFMFEGHDTTASAMAWFLYCMGTHPEHQELVREELHEVFGESDRACTMADIPKMKYLECCIKESLRLYPAVPNFKRIITEDFELGGYQIPAGTTISMHIYALHRNEEFFPDPLTYRPERFMPEESGGRHPFAYVPFSAGARNCIGQRFAMLEEKVIMSGLLRRFRFTYDTVKHGPAIPCADLVLKPKHGMPLIITPLC